MKTIVQINLEASANLRAALLGIYPQTQVHGAGVRVEIDERDQRLQDVLQRLGRSGYRLWNQKGMRDLPREYSMTYIREYDDPDFEAVEYLQIWEPWEDSTAASSSRDAEGRLLLERPERRPGLDFGMAMSRQVIVPHQTYEAFSAATLRHLAFRPAVLTKGRGVYPDRNSPVPWGKTGPWWELTSDLILPPVSPSMDLRDRKGNPVPRGDASQPSWPREGLYNHAELRYLRSDLIRVEPFDVALGFENGHPLDRVEERATVVSKRFYRFCRDQGLRFRYVPVRIEEG